MGLRLLVIFGAVVTFATLGWWLSDAGSPPQKPVQTAAPTLRAPPPRAVEPLEVPQPLPGSAHFSDGTPVPPPVPGSEDPATDTDRLARTHAAAAKTRADEVPAPSLPATPAPAVEPRVVPKPTVRPAVQLNE